MITEETKTHYMQLLNAFLLGIANEELNPTKWPMNEKTFIMILIALFQKYPNSMVLRIDEIPHKGLLEGDYFYLYFFLDAFITAPEILNPMLPIIYEKFPLLRNKIETHVAKNLPPNSPSKIFLELRDI
jgi:hypothetical protein